VLAAGPDAVSYRDSAKAYHSRAWLEATARLGRARRYRRVYRPRTNGKAERFIQTLLREWAYARGYRSSSARPRALPRLPALAQQATTQQLARSPAADQPLTPPWLHNS
jgi:transposase InsO family protein